MINLQHILFVFVLFIFPFQAWCQTPDTSKTTPIIIPPSDKKEEGMITIKKNKYKVNSNWVNFGAGAGINLKDGNGIPVAGIDYNFKVKGKFYKIGYCRNATISYLGSTYYFMNDFHFCLMKRIESLKYNLSYSGGLSGVYVLDVRQADPTTTSFGVYADAQAMYKIFYDLGLGLTAYVNYNFTFPVTGIRLDLYFSNAFKGKVR